MFAERFGKILHPKSYILHLKKSMPRGCLVKCLLAHLVKTRFLREALGHHLVRRRAHGASSEYRGSDAKRKRIWFSRE